MWIDWDAGNDSGSARWASATDQQIDQILAYAVGVLGQPDTIT